MERHERYIQELQKELGQSYPALTELVVQCLHTAPDRRPPSEDVLRRVQGIKADVDEVQGGSMAKHLNIANVLVTKDIKINEKKLQDMQVVLFIFKHL